MKVLVINCGSSSLKYQLIDMEGEVLLCKGLCERIGMENSVITHKLKGGTWSVNTPFPTHAEVQRRRVHGGEHHVHAALDRKGQEVFRNAEVLIGEHLHTVVVA